MLNKAKVVGKWIGYAVKYYAVILAIHKAYQLVEAEIKKIHNEETTEDAAKN